jgi:hypothetical protein
MNRSDLFDSGARRAAPIALAFSSRCRPWRAPLLSLAATLVLAACGGDDTGDTGPAGATGPTGLNSLVTTAIEPASDRCVSGGIRIQSGLDTDRDGVLQLSEITQTQLICNGAAGAAGANASAMTSLVASVVEPAGSHCAAGGTRVHAGLDSNGNGVLDDGEISSTRYVCGGTPGAPGATGNAGLNSLMRMLAEPAGAACAFGGQKITSGLDSNRNSVLDDAEVTSTTYVCHGATGPTGDTGATGPQGPAGPGVTWSQVSSDTQTASNVGYVVNGASQVRLTLPTTPAVGDLIQVSGAGAGGWRLVGTGNQTILTKSLPADYFNPGVRLQSKGLSKAWLPVAMSTNGTKVYAADNSSGRIHYSHDGGETWTESASSVNTSWYSLATSSDGTRVVAGSAPIGGVYVSADSGVTWTQVHNNMQPFALSMSADGMTILAGVISSDALYRSTDFGATWTLLRSLPDAWGNAISANGQVIIAGGNGTRIHKSVDGGVTWTEHGPTGGWQSMRMSRDTTRMVASGSMGVYVSTDSGDTWTKSAAFSTGSYVGMSDDGMTLVHAGNSASIHTSSDGGQTWVRNDAQGLGAWQGVAVSGDGKKAVVGVNNTPLQVSSDERTSTHGGGIAGAQYDTLTLQYLGSNVFSPINWYTHNGKFEVY